MTVKTINSNSKINSNNHSMYELIMLHGQQTERKQAVVLELVVGCCLSRSSHWLTWKLRRTTLVPSLSCLKAVKKRPMLFIKDGYKIRITAITEVGSLLRSLPNWPGLILNSSLYVKKFPFLIFISKFILGFWFYWWIFCFLEGRGVGCWEIEAQKVSEFDWLLLWWRWEAVGGWIHAKWYPFKASVSLYVPSCIICNFFTFLFTFHLRGSLVY